MMGNLLGEVLGAMVVIYVVDEVTGKRKRMNVTREQAEKIKAKQKTAKKKVVSKTPKRKVAKKTTKKKFKK